MIYKNYLGYIKGYRVGKRCEVFEIQKLVLNREQNGENIKITNSKTCDILKITNIFENSFKNRARFF